MGIWDKFRKKETGLSAKGQSPSSPKSVPDADIWHAAIAGDYSRVAELLDTKWGSLNAQQTGTLWSPLHSASAVGQDAIVELLIAKGANVNARDRHEATPLHLAAHNGHLNAVQLLVSNGADVNAQDDMTHRTPELWASGKNHEDIVEFLRNAASASGSGKLQAIRATSEGLRESGPTGQAAFDSLFAEMQNEDAEIRVEAARLLASHAQEKLLKEFCTSVSSEPRKASLAGRALGCKMAESSNSPIDATTVQMMYGIAISFISCVCGHCGFLNKGIAAPPSAPMVAYYGQKEWGTYSIPVLCDKCGNWFHVVWDSDPR